MEDENEGVKDVEEVKPLEESPTPKETTEEAKEPEAEVATPEEESKAETAESSKGANQRIRELVREKKEAQQEAKSLADRLAEVTNPQGFQGNLNPQYKPQYQPGQEISPEQYQADLDRVSDAKIELKIKQNDAVHRIQNESEEAVRKYSQLDTKSDNFDKELSDSVTEATEAIVRQNPYSASPLKIVDRLMKPYLGSVAKEVGKVTEKITKQVSETALRPTSIRTGEKSAKEKSIAELERELGIVQA